MDGQFPLNEMELSTICLTSQDFETRLTSTFEDLYTNQTFTDVTLVGDDHIQLPAHKLVLSACSAVLRDLLLHNPHPHPLLYMRGINSQQLKSLLKYFYLGRTNVFQDSIYNFLAISRDLKVEDLMLTSLAEDGNIHKEPFTVGDGDNIEELAENGPQPLDSEMLDSLQETIEECASTSMNGLSSLENFALESESYYCDQCEYKSVNKKYIKTHKETKHDGIKYYCDQCEYKANTKGHLKKHQNAVHEGVRYPCNQCEFKAIQKAHLKTHQESIHEGIRYTCNQCEYKATTRGHLRKHQDCLHGDKRFACDQCEYQATQISNLRRHLQFKHPELK